VTRRDPLAWRNDRPGWIHHEKRRIVERITVMVLVWAAAFVWCITGD
jgi:hypothetical protein